MLFVSSTMKRDCSAGIKISLSEDGQSLVVTEVKEDHNHYISKVSGIYKKVGRSVNRSVNNLYKANFSLWSEFYGSFNLSAFVS